MKRLLSILAIFVLLLAGCSKKEAKHIIPREQKTEEPAYTQEREGLWQSEDGTAYMGIFENGHVVGFDANAILTGEWTQEDGVITIKYESGAIAGGEGWEYSAGENECTCSYDSETGKLMLDGTIAYVAVYSAEAFRLMADHITAYEAAGEEAWISQVDMNMGSGTVSKLWDGLEGSLLTYLLQTTEDADTLQAEEDAWLTERETALDAVREEYAGGSIAALMVATESSHLTEERFEALLEKLEG